MSILNCSDDGFIECKARKRCADRSPDPQQKYYLLYGCTDGEVSFYSKGIAWEGDKEIRVARLVKSSETADFYRSKKKQLLIIETDKEFRLWCERWKCLALVQKVVWDKFFD